LLTADTIARASIARNLSLTLSDEIQEQLALDDSLSVRKVLVLRNDLNNKTLSILAADHDSIVAELLKKEILPKEALVNLIVYNSSNKELLEQVIARCPEEIIVNLTERKYDIKDSCYVTILKLLIEKFSLSEAMVKNLIKDKNLYIRMEMACYKYLSPEMIEEL
jgi:hypothetical protein